MTAQFPSIQEIDAEQAIEETFFQIKGLIQYALEEQTGACTGHHSCKHCHLIHEVKAYVLSRSAVCHGFCANLMDLNFDSLNVSPQREASPPNSAEMTRQNAFYFTTRRSVSNTP